MGKCNKNAQVGKHVQSQLSVTTGSTPANPTSPRSKIFKERKKNPENSKRPNLNLLWLEQSTEPTPTKQHTGALC